MRLMRPRAQFTPGTMSVRSIIFCVHLPSGKKNSVRSPSIHFLKLLSMSANANQLKTVNEDWLKAEGSCLRRIIELVGYSTHVKHALLLLII